MEYIKTINEFFNNRLYHISNKEFESFYLDFLLKGSGVNVQGKGIYLSESIDFILKYYKKGKKNFLYTVILSGNPLLINFDEKVSDIIYEHLLTLNDSFINQICEPYNRDITGEGLLHNLKMYDNNIERKLLRCGIEGIIYHKQNIKNYCIFNPNIIEILDIKKV